jgi:chromosome segregation ATPase
MTNRHDSFTSTDQIQDRFDEILRIRENYIDYQKNGIDQLIRENGELRERLINSPTYRDNCELNLTIENLKNDINSLKTINRNILTAKNKEIENINKKNKEYKRKNEELNKELEQLKEENSNLIDENQRLRKENNDLIGNRSVISNFDLTNQSISRVLEAINARNDSAFENETLRRQITDISDYMSSQDKRIDSLNTGVKLLEKELRDLEIELRLEKVKNNELSDKIKNLNAKLNERDNNLISKQKEIDVLEGCIVKLANTIKNLQEEIYIVHERNRLTMTEINNLDTKLVQKYRECKLNEEKIRQIKQNLIEYDASNQRLNNEMKKLGKQSEKLKIENEFLDRKIFHNLDSRLSETRDVTTFLRCIIDFFNIDPIQFQH